jgi:hypothetical protein
MSPTWIRYVGEDRHAVLSPADPWGPRFKVLSGSAGQLVRKTNAGCLVKVRGEDRRWLYFWCPRWQLRRRKSTQGENQ